MESKDIQKKRQQYQRIQTQISELLQKKGNFMSRLATIVSVLHHKRTYFFWTGFYLLDAGELIVGPYQGPLACQLLQKNKGVCWAAINQGKTLIVPDVEQFPDHIACDSRSKSEVVVPLKNKNNEIIGVLDVDSTALNSFDEIDGEFLTAIVNMI